MCYELTAYSFFIMRIGRTLPPAAAPIYFRDIFSGIKGLFRRQRELDHFKSELKDYFGAKHCFLVSSGKAALTIILKALQDAHPDRDEVLIPAFTCYSVPSAIVRAGLKVRLCDISPDTLDFDFEQLPKILSQASHAKASRKTNELSATSDDLPSLNPQPGTITQAHLNHSDPSAKRSSSEAVLPPCVVSNRLLAIIPTDLFGLPADIDQLRMLVHDPEIIIVEDAAQAMGGEWKDRKLGTLGDVSFFSLGRGKALSTVEGGIILTDREDIADRIGDQLEKIAGYGPLDLMRLVLNAVLLSSFLHPSLYWIPKSVPFLRLGETIYDPNFNIKKMSAFQAGLVKGWQEKVKNLGEIRKKNTKHWTSFLEETHISLYWFGKTATQQTQITQATQLPDLIRFPVRANDGLSRERILVESERMGLGIMPSYPDAISGIDELRDDFQDEKFPVAKEQSQKLLTLPIHPFVSENDKQQIVALISSIADSEPLEISAIKQQDRKV